MHIVSYVSLLDRLDKSYLLYASAETNIIAIITASATAIVMSPWELLDRFIWFGIPVEVGETVCADTDEADVVLVTFLVDVGEIACVDVDDADVDVVASEHDSDGS